MLKIRLQRAGKKKSPSFRVVLAEHTSPVKGKFLEILGFYNPKLKEKGLKKDRIEYWLSQGVQMSDTVHNLFVDEGITKDEKIKAWKPKKKAAGEGEEAAAEAPKAEAGADVEQKPAADKPVEEKVAEEKPEEVKEEKKEEEQK